MTDPVTWPLWIWAAGTLAGLAWFVTKHLLHPEKTRAACAKHGLPDDPGTMYGVMAFGAALWPVLPFIGLILHFYDRKTD